MEDHNLYYLGIKALIISSKGQVLLVHDARSHKLNNTSPYWDLPGGRVQKGGSVEKTLRRELEEELGIKDLEIGHFFAASVSNHIVGDKGLILFSYRCRIAEGIEMKLSNEHDEYGWFEKQEAAKLLEHKYPKDFVDKIKGLSEHVY